MPYFWTDQCAAWSSNTRRGRLPQTVPLAGVKARSEPRTVGISGAGVSGNSGLRSADWWTVEQSNVEALGLDVRLCGVVCRHGRLEAVSGVDPEVARGERIALTGTNGSGKTTLLRAAPRPGPAVPPYATTPRARRCPRPRAPPPAPRQPSATNPHAANRTAPDTC
ncbi:ATP-binding cassette domain-containing protein [Streptomyces noursei]|uniref:ATP-binding cassette domain-containing protein n=1 Tax=Streptomyces noursei TaxID=1971 RepID=UPI003B8A8AE9